MWKSGYLLVAAVWCCVVAASAVDNWRPLSHRLRTVQRRSGVEETPRAADDGRWWLPVSQLRGLRSLYEECVANQDSVDQGVACLKGKALVLMGRAMTKQNVTLAEGITLVRNEDASARTMRMVTTERQLEETLPRDLGQREERLDEMLGDHITSFLQTHSVRINLSGQDLQRSFSEARKKSKKGLPYILFAVFALKKLALAYSLKLIALIAAKALLLAKIALVLSAVIGLKKILSHEPEHHSEVVAHTRTEPYHHGGHYGRNFQFNDEEAHKMAYNNQIPRST